MRSWRAILTIVYYLFSDAMSISRFNEQKSLLVTPQQGCIYLMWVAISRAVDWELPISGVRILLELQLR